MNKSCFSYLIVALLNAILLIEYGIRFSGKPSLPNAILLFVFAVLAILSYGKEPA